MNVLLKAYLECNLIMMAAFLVTVFLLRLPLTRTFTMKQLLRFAQVMLIASLAAPALMNILPQDTLPPMYSTNLGPLPENEAAVVKTFRHLKRRIQGPAIATNPENQRAWHFNFKRELVACIRSALFWALLLFAGFLLKTAWLIREFKALTKLLESALVIRRVGAVVIGATDLVSVPFSCRTYRRRWVVMPFETAVHDIDRLVVINHEMQHHRQGDTLWVYLMELVGCLFYLNPVTQFWKHKITELQELACDEALIGRERVSSYEYASCLVRVAGAALHGRAMRVGTACMATETENATYFKSFLRRRVEMLSNYEVFRRPSRLGIIIGATVIFSTFGLAYATQQSLRSADAPNPGFAWVDPDIQSIADRVLNKAVLSEGAEAGIAIVSEPATGRVLAVANVDTRLRMHKNSSHWGLSYLVEPASLMKGLFVTAAVEDNASSWNDRHNCGKGNYRYNGRVYHDWTKKFDYLTTAETVIHSSNICGMKVAQQLTAPRLSDYLGQLGFGPGGTAAQFPGARPGVMPSLEDLSQPAYIAAIATGYNRMFVTPLEVVAAYGAIANGGNLMVPLQASEAPEKARILRRVFSEKTASESREVLARVVTEGTGKGQIDSATYTLAGKTATGMSPENPEHDSLGGLSNVAQFVGFGPATKPQVEVYVAMLMPSKAKAHGSSHAGPVFKDITEQTLKYLGVPGDKIP